MTWNDIILDHPHLSPTDKLVFHLLIHLGGDSPRTRRQLRRWLGLSDRHLRRVRDQLHAFGFYLPAPSAPLQSTQEPAPEGADAQVQTGRTCPVEADIQVHSGRTCPPPDVHVRSSNARARTPSTSSKEEVTTLPSFKEGRMEKLAVPEGDPAETAFAAQFAAYWQDLAPDGALPSQQQLKALQKDVGPDLVLTVARYFLMAGRNLSGLKNPDKAWNYFCRACQSEARTGKLRPQSRPTETERSSITATRSMAELYLLKRSRA